MKIIIDADACPKPVLAVCKAAGEKYNIEDIPLSGLDMPFIEALDYYFWVKRGMKPRTVKARIVLLNKVVRLALQCV